MTRFGSFWIILNHKAKKIIQCMVICVIFYQMIKWYFFPVFNFWRIKIFKLLFLVTTMGKFYKISYLTWLWCSLRYVQKYIVQLFYFYFINESLIYNFIGLKVDFINIIIIVCQKFDFFQLRHIVRHSFHSISNYYDFQSRTNVSFVLIFTYLKYNALPNQTFCK